MRDPTAKTITRAIAAARYREARRQLDALALDEFAAGTVVETEEFLWRNEMVHQTARGVSWWQRWRIDRQVLDELGFWEQVAVIEAETGRRYSSWPWQP